MADNQTPDSGLPPKSPKIPGISVGTPKRVKISTVTLKGKKLNLKWILVFGVGIAGIIFAASMLAPTPPKPPAVRKQLTQISLTPHGINSATFARHTQEQFGRVRQELLQMKSNQGALTQSLGAVNKNQKALEQLIKNQDAKLAAQQKLLAAKQAPVQLPPPPPPPQLMAPPPAPMPGGVSGGTQGAAPSATHASGLGYFLSPAHSGNAAQAGARMAEAIVKNPYAGYIPAGSFLPGVLLTGVEANTATSTQGNPQPVLMRIQRAAVLPNNERYDIAGCFVIGSATGSISAHRADIRLATLSCTNRKHQMVLEARIKGFVADSDGEFGLRGKLVERRGALLEKSLLAGFASGLGQAFANSQSQMYSGSFGTGQVFSGPSAVEGGAMNGAGQAMNSLAQFYLNQAKNIFPVIDVPPGRKVTLVIVKGAAYHWHNAHSLYIVKTTPVKLVSPVKHTIHKEPARAMQ